MLFMSDAPVKFRIDYILSQEYFYLHYVLCPIIFGSLLAVITPYTQWLLSRAHKWATDKHSENIYQTREKDYQDTIKLSALKVQAEREVEKVNAQIDADIKAEVERGKREESITEEMETVKKELLDEINRLRQNVTMEQEAISSIKVEKEKLQDFIVSSLELLDDFFKVDNSQSLKQVKGKIESLLTFSDIDASTIRNALRQNKELTQEQVIKFFEDAEENLKKEKAGKVSMESLMSD
ncbi:hypothetical protein HV079_12525 [Citrobacter freundii]|nr:hypothetical protein HV079_12525 [Citrobacter freundii]